MLIGLCVLPITKTAGDWSSYFRDFKLPAGAKMVRFAFLILGVVAMATSGCCGPAGCGIGCAPGCGSGGCGTTVVNTCGGGCCYGPLAAARIGVQNARRALICGSGCGEAYIGEWISTPPDCKDPCFDSQFVGGAVKARPFCRPRGSILRSLTGVRYCSGSQSSAPCGCGVTSCGGGCSTEQVISSYSEVVGVQEGGCGCASCTAASPMATRLAGLGSHPTGDSITASARARQTLERAQRIRR